MLQTQVNYWNLREQALHNRVTESIQQFEAETSRRSQEEQARHNIASENLGFQQLSETKRHNIVNEQQGWANINISQQGVDLQRSGLQETIRSHKANEAISWENINLGYGNLSVAKVNASTQASKVANEYALGKYQNYTNRLNAFSNQQNANSNTSNAKVNITNATTREREQDLKEADTYVHWFQNLISLPRQIQGGK